MEISSRHRVVLLVIPLAVAIILRLYPYFLSGVPWGTDAWPLIKNTNEMLANSPTTLGGNPIFDSYNIYWPGVSLFGAASSLIFGAPPIAAMPIMVPLAASLTTLFFFLIVEKLTKRSTVACIASLFFATAGFDAIFTASATKESFAYPLFMLAVLLLFVKTDAKAMIIFTVVSITLALSHHVTMIILLAVAGAIVITNVAFSIGGYKKLERTWILPLIVAVVFVAYVLSYARVFFTSNVTGLVISLDSLIPLVALFAVSLAVAVYFSLARRLRSMLAEGLTLLGVSLALLYLSTRTSVLPLAPTVPPLIAAISLPYLLVGFFAVFGYKALHDSDDKSSFAFSSSWLAATIAIIGYALIGTPNGVALIYRLFTFVYAPLALFGAFYLVKLSGRVSKGSLAFATRVAVALIIIGIIFASSYMSYASVVGRENILGGHYAYSRSDYTSAQFVSSSLPKSFTIASDDKILNLYSGYFGVSVNLKAGYEYLLGIDQLGTNSSQMLLTYSSMSSEGYDLILYGLPVPASWFGSFSNQSSLVFDNGNEMIWK